MYIKIPRNKIARMEIVKTNCRTTLVGVVERYHPDYVINGGLYDMRTGRVNEIPLRINGKTIATSDDGYWMMAWNDGPDICMIHSSEMKKWKYAVACSTMLKDGKRTVFIFTPAQTGTRGRTALGDDADNLHLFVSTDNKGAVTPTGLRTTMENYGAKDAIMLDCGGSSQMYALGKYYQAEKRKVSYWICVWLDDEDTAHKPTETPSKCPYNEPSTNVRLGASGDSVRWIQWHLKASVAPELPIDGVFYTRTRIAVIEFQKKYKITPDGIVGKATRRAMKNAVS